MGTQSGIARPNTSRLITVKLIIYSSKIPTYSYLRCPTVSKKMQDVLN